MFNNIHKVLARIVSAITVIGVLIYIGMYVQKVKTIENTLSHHIERYEKLNDKVNILIGSIQNSKTKAALNFLETAKYKNISRKNMLDSIDTIKNLSPSQGMEYLIKEYNFNKIQASKIYSNDPLKFDLDILKQNKEKIPTH